MEPEKNPRKPTEHMIPSTQVIEMSHSPKKQEEGEVVIVIVERERKENKIRGEIR